MSKKETCREHWLKAHSQIRLYLNKEEYEILKQINPGSSIGDILPNNVSFRNSCNLNSV
jgi:DTW domain-containing protein YfiP